MILEVFKTAIKLIALCIHVLLTWSEVVYDIIIQKLEQPKRRTTTCVRASDIFVYRIKMAELACHRIKWGKWYWPRTIEIPDKVLGWTKSWSRNILLYLSVVFYMCVLEILYLKPSLHISSWAVYICTIYMSYTSFLTNVICCIPRWINLLKVSGIYVPSTPKYSHACAVPEGYMKVLTATCVNIPPRDQTRLGGEQMHSVSLESLKFNLGFVPRIFAEYTVKQKQYILDYDFSRVMPHQKLWYDNFSTYIYIFSGS